MEQEKAEYYRHLSNIDPLSFCERGQQRDMQKALEALIKCADDCLYHAKKQGRNRIIHKEEVGASPQTPQGD